MEGNIFDLLSNDERVIVYSSEEDGSLVTWNQSLTLQQWRQSNDYPQFWEEVDILTSDKPLDFAKARETAINWMAGAFD